MESNTSLAIGAVITMAMLLSGAYYISLDDDAYYCEERDIIMICEKLSSGIGTRCYFDETYKVCTEGWTKLEINTTKTGTTTTSIVTTTIPQTTTTIFASVSVRSKWRCSPESCIKIG